MEDAMRTAPCCPVIELRQYVMKPGGRDALTDLFEAALLEGQEELGMTVIGPFRDEERSNRFVWLRGFADMAARARQLEAFYGGPVWARHKQAANETMIDSDDVLLLRPARPGSGFRLTGDPFAHADRVVTATICHVDGSRHEAVTGFFEDELAPAIRAAGARVLAYLVSETSENTFPALPVREGEQVFTWFLGFRDRVALGDYPTDVAAAHPGLLDALGGPSAAAFETRLLSPTRLCRMLSPHGA